MIGFLTIAAISSSSDRLVRIDAGGRRLLFPTRALAGIFSWPRSCFSWAAPVGRLQILDDLGSIPFSRSNAKVRREVLQRGLW